MCRDRPLGFEQPAIRLDDCTSSCDPESRETPLQLRRREQLVGQVVQAGERVFPAPGPSGGPISAIPVTCSSRRPAAASSSRHSV